MSARDSDCYDEVRMQRALVHGLGVLAGLLVAGPAMAAHSDAPLQVISLADLKTQLDAGRRPILVDLRPAEEFRQGRLPGARSIPIRECPSAAWR